MATPLKLLTDAVARSTGRRYCSTHNGNVDAAAGSVVQRGRFGRWVCFTCQEKRRIAQAR